MAEQNTEELEKQSELTEQNTENTKELVTVIKKLTEAYKKNNNLLDEELDTTEDIRDVEVETNKTLTKRTSILDGLKKSLDDIKKSASETFRITGLTGFSLKEVVTQTIKINSELTKMSATLGEVNGNGFTQVKQAFTTATKEIGESFEEAKETVNALINDGYIGNFNEATRAISLFSRATDVSRTNVAATYDFLNKTMKMSEEGIASIYATMQKVSQTYGLTKKGMEIVSSSIKGMTSNMKAFGSNETNIKQMAAGTARLASQFEKVGLEASKATEMVAKLTDPDNIENNIGLYAQLGMSISDALTGNFDDAQMRTGLADFGNRLKEMGPIAGSAFAKTFGISYKEAMQYADMEQTTENAVTPEVKAMEELTKGLEKTQDGFAAMQTAINKIKGALSSLSPVLLGVLALVVPKVTKFIKDTLQGIKDTFDELKNGANGVESKNVKPKSNRAEDIIAENSRSLSINKEEYNGFRKSNIDITKMKDFKASKIAAGVYSSEEIDKLKIQMSQTLKENKEALKANLDKMKKEAKSRDKTNDALALEAIKLQSFANAAEKAKKDLENKINSIPQYKIDYAKKVGESKAKGRVGGALSRASAEVGRVGGAVKSFATGGMSTAGGVLGGASKIFGGIGKVAGGFMKALGPIGIVLSILLPILQKNQKFMNMINKITTKVTNMLEESLMPVIDSLAEALMPLMETLFTIISPLLKIIAPILKLLIQPTIWVVKLLNWILQPLKWIAQKLGGGSLDDNTEAIKENTEAQTNAPEQIRANADGRVVASKVSIANSATQTENTANNSQQLEKDAERQNNTDNIVYSVGANIATSMNFMVEQLKELINIQKNMFSQPDTKDNLVRIIEDGTSGIRLTVPVQTSGNNTTANNAFGGVVDTHQIN